MEFYVETERLILREFRAADAPDLFAMDRLAEVHRYLGNNPITQLATAVEVIEMVQQQYLANGIGRWMAVEKASGKVIGWAGLKLITTYENNQTNFYDVGYRLHPLYWGKGYATESAKAALAYGFNHFDMPKIVGTCHVNNVASRRALEKCGLSYIASYMHADIPCDWLEIERTKWENTIN